MQLLSNSIYAATTNEQALEFVKLSDRLARYSIAHKRTVQILEFLDSTVKFGMSSGDYLYQAKKLLQKIDSCGHWLSFAQFVGVKGIKLDSADFCKKHIVCPLCAARRASVLIDRYKQRYQQVINPLSGYFTTKGEYRNPAAEKKLFPYMLTLTVKNSVDLQQCFEHLKSAFTGMKKQRNDVRNHHRHRAIHSQLFGVEAMLYAYEITRPKQTWHPHVHSFILCESGKEPDFPYQLRPQGICPTCHQNFKFSQAKKKRSCSTCKKLWGEFEHAAKESGLAKEWLHYTGDSYIVDLKLIDDVEKGFQEVLKYFVKFGDLSVEENFEVFCELGGKHFVGSLGHFYGVADLGDDELARQDLSKLDFEAYFFKYFVGRYKQVDFVDGLSGFREVDREREYAEYVLIDEKIRRGEFPQDFWHTSPDGAVDLDDDDLPF